MTDPTYPIDPTDIYRLDDPSIPLRPLSQCLPAPARPWAVVPKPAGDAIRLSERRRWWRLVIARLQRAAADPIRTTSTRHARVVNVLGVYGIRIEHATGLISSHLLVRGSSRLQRQPMEHPDIALSCSPASPACLEHLVRRDAWRWAREAGAQDLDFQTVQLRTRRLRGLCQLLWQRWAADGTLVRLRAAVEQAFALDPDRLRLARLIARRRCGAIGVDEGDYNRAVADFEALLLLEREAPKLMRLFVALMPPGECQDEPKRAMRTAFVDCWGAPRHWRRFVALPAAMLQWAQTAPAEVLQGHRLIDLAYFISALDSPVEPPQDWLQLLLDRSGGASLVYAVRGQEQAAALRAHLDAWVMARDSDRPRLIMALQTVLAWLDDEEVSPPSSPRKWSWWTRSAKAWDRRARQAAARLVADAHTFRAAPLADGQLELHLLNTALALHDESRAMANCLHDWWRDVSRGSAAVWSVRCAQTGQRLASAGICEHSGWALEVRAFANRPVDAGLQAQVARLLEPQRLRCIAEAQDRPQALILPAAMV